MCYYGKKWQKETKMRKTNSIEIEIDKLGRILIPIKIRKKLGIVDKSKMMLSLENEGIILSPIRYRCVLCGCQMEEEKQVQLCDECIYRVKRS